MSTIRVNKIEPLSNDTVEVSVKNSVKVINTISDLLSLAGTTEYLVFVNGYYSGSNAGGGLFKYNSTRAGENDLGTIVNGWERIITDGVISPQMFGAKADGLADDSVPFAAALTAAGNGTVEVSGSIRLPAGAVKLSGFVCPSVRGIGDDPTIIVGSSPLSIDGGSGALCKAVWEGITFEGNGSNTLVQVAGQGGVRFDNCNFKNAAIGLLVHNRDSGMFTEFVVADNCNFESSCLNALTYRITNGNNSFHGTGLRNCTINTPASGTIRCVSIEAGCLVYNAPLSVQVWSYATATLIHSAVSTKRNSFYGVITTERFAGTLTVAEASANYPIYFAGKMNIMNESIALGDLVLCESIALLSNGSIQTRGGKWAKSFSLTTGANALAPVPYGVAGWCSLCSISLIANNYDYRYILAVFNGDVATSAVYIVATMRTFNAAGYGAPTFGVNSFGQITITNAAYPVSGVQAIVDFNQLAQSNNDIRIL